MKRSDVERAIIWIAARQHGIVTRAQLLEAGVSADQIDRRVEDRRLRPLQRGVYRVGPLEARLTRAASAVLSCGESAVLSHGSAAALWDLCEPDADVVDVIVTSGARRRRGGVRAHRTALQRDEITRREGLPVTTPTRTLFDLASVVTGRELERVVAEAMAQRLATRSGLERLLRRYARRPASGRLAEIMGSGRRPALTRSAAEEALLSLIRKAQLPPPDVNVRVAGFEADFYWRRAGLVVEVDGFAFHTTRRKFESDRRRDAVLLASGVRVMRVTWQQLEEEREALLVRLAQVLLPVAARPARPSASTVGGSRRTRISRA